jgi:bacteriocin biosynthesis cyclodehydratase domain-containing protein
MNDFRSSGRGIGFKRHLRVEVVPGDAVYLFSERRVTVLQNALLEEIAPLLDGTRDVPDLLRDLPSGVSPEQVGKLIDRLVEADLVSLRPATDGADWPSTAYWESIGLDAAAAQAARCPVRLMTVGDVDEPTARAMLGATGLRLTRGAGETCAFTVVLCDDYLAPGLPEVAAEQRDLNQAYLLAKPTGGQVWIGPVFEPAGQACWHCLAARQWTYRQAEAHVQAALGRNGGVARPPVSLQPLFTAAMNLIGLEAAKWLAGYRYPGQRAVWTFDSAELTGRRHEVRGRPQCAHCGDAGLMRAQARRPVRLSARVKASTSDGGHRSRRLESIWVGYRHLISPVSGVIKEIKRDRRGPAFFKVFKSGPTLVAGVRGLNNLRAALRQGNGGKGVTGLDAKVSALCEALERHSATFQGDEERIQGSYRSLGEAAIHPNTCQLFHERQYSNRSAWNRAHSHFQYVYEPFDEHAVIDWTPVWSLTRQEHRLLPTDILYLGKPGSSGRRFGHADSNGNAAGASIEDAVLQGLLELVERDAVALWWYNRTRQPAVDLTAFTDPWIEELLKVYAELQREVWVLDLTSDLRVPTMAALTRHTGSTREAIMFGFGAHLDPRVALRRALTELNQLMPLLAESGPDRQTGHADPDMTHWLRHATVQNQPYLLPDPDRTPTTPAGYHYLPNPDLLDDIRTIQRRLDQLGLELLVLDQTRPDIGLPVVKVIVPGLRHFWARFAPGRLYEVPVRTGRRTSPVEYDDLNPIPIFI